MLLLPVPVLHATSVPQQPLLPYAYTVLVCSSSHSRYVVLIGLQVALILPWWQCCLLCGPVCPWLLGQQSPQSGGLPASVLVLQLHGHPNPWPVLRHGHSRLCRILLIRLQNICSCQAGLICQGTSSNACLSARGLLRVSAHADCASAGHVWCM